MGFFTSLTKLFPQMVQDPSFGQPIGWPKNIITRLRRHPQMVQDPSFGQPIGWGKNIIPIATLVRDSALQALPAGNAGVPQGSNAPAASGKGPTDIIGGLGAPEQLPGGGYRVFDNRTGKYIYGGGATDPNAPATPRVTPAEPSPATPAAPAPPPVEAPSSQSIGSIVFPKRQMTPDGILASLMRVMGGALPQGPGTENAPTGFGRFLRSLAANRFIS